MKELFLIVWIVSGLCGMVEHCPEIAYQIVSAEAELNEIYQEHKNYSTKVFKSIPMNSYWDKKYGWVGDNAGNIVELEFKSEPCGEWVEKGVNYIDGRVIFNSEVLK